MRKLDAILRALRLLASVRIETGNLTTPSGEEYHGFKVTIGKEFDSSNVQRTYDDIEKILGKNNIAYKVEEERRINGTFKSYTVETIRPSD